MTNISYKEVKPVIDALNKTVEISSVVIDISGLINKGFDFVFDATATFEGKLMGSVSARNWTDIDDLDGSIQGAIAGHFNFIKLDITKAGIWGTSEIFIAGQ